MKLPLRARLSLGLSLKFILVTATISVVLTLLLTVAATRQLRRSLVEAHTSEGAALALGLARAAEYSATSDGSTLRTLVDDLSAHEGVSYIYVTDATGRVLAHSFRGTPPTTLLSSTRVDPSVLAESATKRLITPVDVDTAEGHVRGFDVAVRLGSKRGVVHVGISREHIERRAEELPREMLVLAVLIVAGSVVLTAVFVRTIVRPLRELTDVAAHIVESGDLTRAIQVKSGDEVGRLARSFSMMVEKLREVTINLQQAADALKQSTDHLNASSAEQALTVSRQAAALQETQVTAHEIRQTSLVAAQKAESVLAVAERADELARSGEAAIEMTMAGLNDIRAQAGEIAQKILELGERTKQIGGITQTVKDLADQSNMLALNAAIESVRSGEHGKGFGVVAREIRALADQSIQATSRVRELLDDISGSVTAAVRITERGAERMESGLTQVRTSGQNLRELSNIVQDNASAVRQIAAAVNQQNVGINQITQAVNELSQMMDETVARIGSTGEAATTLQIISEQLSSAVKSYRVE
ncbi:methyl-accepting chemotaxis protein [Hyalangium rubrum]|uniref:Methyl-accepting chemotaxis protein n=1 Tax=Hyalangium rubrum TaxID=3103134 RepID=A0ABU5HFB1_9BACT|nr:methyl-accepting chemotaxis protein [Hyalangium sp. s54d21]MDY7232046.1 methyl-accepting chemotaxis protein [Hyalangium sp. s54d21]